MSSFGVSPKKSSSFNIFSTSAIIFIRCLNRHHMRNNIRYKGNSNNTSVIIFLIDTLDDFCKLSKNSRHCTSLRRTSRRFLWCWLLFFIHCCFFMLVFVVFTFPGYFSMPPALHPVFLGPVKASTSSELYPGYFRLLYFSVTFLPRALRFWVGIFYPRAFFILGSFPTFLPQLAFIKASVGADSSSSKFARLHADPRNTGPAHLLVWFTAIHNLDIQKNSYLNRIKYYHKLL